MVSLQQRQTLQSLDVPDVDGRVSAHLNAESQSESLSVSLMVTCCVLISRTYLCRGHIVFERVDGEAEDVVVVTEVESLTVLRPVVDDGDGSHVIHHLPRLTVEQVVTTVKAPIPAGNRKSDRHSKSHSRTLHTETHTLGQSS